jgi:hypothetical protein
MFTVVPNMSHITLHPLLQYSHHDVIGNPCSPLLWDLREHPTYMRFVKNNRKPTSYYLDQPATTPAVTYLDITCGLFPIPWSIEAHNPRGVTIYDVLRAIYHVTQTAIIPCEWEMLSEKHQDRVAVVFEDRWSSAYNRMQVRSFGVTRADCLLRSTSFAGLSMSYDKRCSAILTLSRNSRLEN